MPRFAGRLITAHLMPAVATALHLPDEHAAWDAIADFAPRDAWEARHAVRSLIPDALMLDTAQTAINPTLPAELAESPRRTTIALERAARTTATSPGSLPREAGAI